MWTAKYPTKHFTSASDSSGDGGKYVLHKFVLVWLKTRLAGHWIIKLDKQKLYKESYCDVILCDFFFFLLTLFHCSIASLS